MRMTGPLVKILAVLVPAEGREMYGYELLAETGVKAGTLYPLLDRLEAAGWARSRWEADAGQGRPRRRYYRLTPSGEDKARALLAEHRVAPTRPVGPFAGERRGRFG